MDSVISGDVSVGGVTHPLAPLTEAEIRTASEIVRAQADIEGELCFEMIELNEPGKNSVRAFKPGDPIKREARFNVYRKGSIGVWRGVVSIDEGRIVSLEHLPDKRPMIMLEEFLEIESAVKGDAQFIEACAKRGITDMSLVCVDPWSAGDFGVSGEEGRHISHTFSWVRNSEFDHLYAHPIEGICAVVDVKTLEVIRVDDYGVVPVPKAEYNYERQFQTKFRDDLRPIDIVQPEGVSFTLDGQRLKWHEWSLLVGFNAREGITLHDISYGGRPVLYRASLAEMVIPYGSPLGGHARKNVFDIGEYGLGKLANSLELGCDCLGSIAYLDAWISDINGAPYCIKNAICIHEEDDGILWKHWDFRTDRAEVRRARRLVVSSFSTVGNYEYGSYWRFYLDGTIEFDMKATGIINTTACEPGKPSKYGTEVAPGIVGQIHQHIFCARLDLAVDGDSNAVVEANTVAEPDGAQNPHGNAYYVEETRLKSESDAQRTRNDASLRYWKFINPNKTNAVGQPVGYKLEPQHSAPAFISPDSPSGRRSQFIEKHLWVTKYDPEERFPAGEYMHQSDGADGLPAFAARNRSIDDEDIVAWHVFTIHHQPRPEDWPVQPCVSTGFKLIPNGFFDTNPTLDLDPGKNKSSCHANAAD